MNVLKLSRIKEIIIYGFFPFLMLDYFSLMFGYDFHRIFGTPFILGVDILALITCSLFITKNRNNLGKILFILWLFYNLASLLGYIYNGKPTTCYFGMIRPLVFPMLFFFIGSTEKKDNDTFYLSFMYSCLVCYIIGLFLYFSMPSSYVSYLSRINENTWYGTNATEEYILSTARMSSFFGDSYAISYTSVPAFIICLSLLFKKTCLSNRILLFFASICLISALLCQQRSAMFFAILVLFFFIFWGWKKKNTLLFKYALIVCLIIFVAISYFALDPRFSVVFDNVFDRFKEMSFADAMDSSRPDQYKNAIKACHNFIIGDGIGSISSIARRYGFLGVSDGEYIRIFVETGIVGSILFIILIFKTLYRCYIDLNRYVTEFLIIAFFLFAMIGSNSLSINYFYSIIFWFSIGRVWSSASFSNSN